MYLRQKEDAVAKVKILRSAVCVTAYLIDPVKSLTRYSTVFTEGRFQNDTRLLWCSRAASGADTYAESTRGGEGE